MWIIEEIGIKRKLEMSSFYYLPGNIGFSLKIPSVATRVQWSCVGEKGTLESSLYLVYSHIKKSEGGKNKCRIFHWQSWVWRASRHFFICYIFHTLPQGTVLRGPLLQLQKWASLSLLCPISVNYKIFLKVLRGLQYSQVNDDIVLFLFIHIYSIWGRGGGVGLELEQVEVSSHSE